MPEDLEDLKEKIRISWEEIDQKLIEKCIDHCHNRMKEVFKNKGEFS